jgi:hypothetical protein
VAATGSNLAAGVGVDGAYVRGLLAMVAAASYGQLGATAWEGVRSLCLVGAGWLSSRGTPSHLACMLACLAILCSMQHPNPHPNPHPAAPHNPPQPNCVPPHPPAACRPTTRLPAPQVYKLPSDRLYATYFGGDASQGLPPDEEARSIWLQFLPEDRVLPFDCKDNFWEMGDQGPCGPCTGAQAGG